MTAPGNALAVIEVSSLARGYVILDTLVKRARVSVLWHRELSPGKSVIVFGGEEEATLEAHRAGLAASTTTLLDDLLLPQAHPLLWDALAGRFAPRPGDAAGIVEVATVASTLLAADAALKTTPVGLARLRLAAGIGGRGLFVLAGPLDEIQAAAAAARDVVKPERLVGCEVVTHPHAEVWGFYCDETPPLGR